MHGKKREGKKEKLPKKWGHSVPVWPIMTFPVQTLSHLLAHLLVDIGENGEADSNVKVSLQDSWTEQETNVLRYRRCRGAGYFDVLRFRVLVAECSLSTIFSTALWK